MRTDNKGQGMKEELIKYVMAEADKCYADDFPIHEIENWIREFFNSYQPKRSKREDLCFCEYCEEVKSKDKILGFLCKQCMQEM